MFEFEKFRKKKMMFREDPDPTKVIIQSEIEQEIALFSKLKRIDRIKIRLLGYLLSLAMSTRPKAWSTQWESNSLKFFG